MRSYILAHRGASASAPENTRASFQMAIDLGADGVEFDVQMTKDNQLVVIHDEYLERTTGFKGYVRDFTLNEIKKLDAGKYFSRQYKDERILTLNETLDIVKDCKLINIELKNGLIEYENMEEKVIKSIHDWKLKDKTIISSFNHDSVNKVKKIDCRITTGILYFARLYNPWYYAFQVGADAIHPYYPGVKRELIKRCHQKAIKVNVFLVNDEKDILDMIKQGADAIITDYPEKAYAIIKKLPE